MKVNVVVEQDDNGCFAYCPQLEGCHSQGKNIEDALANIREAIDLYLEPLSPEEVRERLSREVLTTSLEVKVA